VLVDRSLDRQVHRTPPKTLLPHIAGSDPNRCRLVGVAHARELGTAERPRLGGSGQLYGAAQGMGSARMPPAAAGNSPACTLAEALGQHLLGGPDQSRGTVGDDQERQGQASTGEVGEEPGPGVVALGLARGQADEHRCALGGDAPGDEHRLAGAPGWNLKWRPIEEQVVEGDPRQVPRAPGLELDLDGLKIRETVDLDKAASEPRASAKVASTSRTDRPRTKLAMTSDSKALVRHTPVPSSREAKAFSVPRSFGRSRVIGPEVVLMVVGQWPLRLPCGPASPTSAPGCGSGVHWQPRNRPTVAADQHE